MAIMLPGKVFPINPDRFKNIKRKGLQGEKEVFNKLKNAFKDNDDYYIYYHLKPNYSPQEPDFFIYNRNFGIICIEVKNWYKIDYTKDDKWVFIKKNSEVSEPQDVLGQAFKYCKAFTDDFKSFSANKKKFHGVYIPLVIFVGQTKIRNFNQQQKEHYGDQTFLNDTKKLIKWFEYMVNHYRKKYRKNKPIDEETHMQILDYMNQPALIDGILYRKQILDINENIVDYTNKVQDSFIEKYSEETNFIVKGEAGTGKSWLALKLLQRFIKKNMNGEFLVYNSMVCDYLNEIGKEYFNLSGFKIKTLNSFIKEKLGAVNFTSYGPFSEGNKELCGHLIKYFNSNPKEKQDFIIVDEVQDFDLDIIETLKKIKKDPNIGLYLFIDPNQTIVPVGNKSAMKPEEYLHKISGVINLQKNLRPTKIIRNSNQIINFIKDYTNLNLSAEAKFELFEKPSKKVAKNYKDLWELTNQQIKDWLSRYHISTNDITILGNKLLSAYSPPKSKSNKNYIGDFTLISKGAAVQSENSILFRKITEFKGCESEAVIIWWKGDFPRNPTKKDILSEKKEQLFYVGASRAKHLLKIFVLN